MRSLHHPVFALVLAATVAGSADAQVETWVSLDSSKPAGATAEIEFVEVASTPTDAYFDVHIYGFWRADIVAPDNSTYQRVRVPGLDRLGLIGAPDLPVARVDLVEAANAGSMVLVSATTFAQTTFTNYLVYPQVKPGNDEDIDPNGDPGPGDTNGSDDAFVKDTGIYALSSAYPSTDADASAPTTTRFSGIPAARPTIHPVRWDPSSQKMTVKEHSRYHYQSQGHAATFQPITKDAAKLAAATFLNWPEMEGSGTIAADQASYSGRYLIVTEAQYLPTLDPFIAHRKSLGLEVTIHIIPSSGNICGNLRGAIDNWHQLGPAGFDHYCLLVGDLSVIPQCVSPNIDQDPTDDMYGSPSGTGDLDEEVFVGRLCVDDEDDLENQIDKIMAYELNPSNTQTFQRALLVAHDEDAPGKYEGAHEEVANAAYSNPPIFMKRYGSNITSTNSSVQSDINGGIGLVAYRGHGSTNTWSDWNGFQNFHKNEVLTLNNGARTPVVWSFSCTNSNISSNDCIAETWLEYEDGGAVAHYGSTTVSGTAQNHVLDKKMFEAIYDIGLTTHSHAIAWAESEMAAAESGNNSWMYMLNGCPWMKIRTGPPKTLDLVAPPEVETCPTQNCFLTIVVKDGGGQPLPGILVAAHKPGVGSLPDELDFTGYTGTGGVVSIPLGPMSLGFINVTGRDDEGNIAGTGVTVTDGAWADLGFPLAGTNGVEPELEGTGTLVAGTPASINLSNAAPSAPAALFVSPFNSPQPFEGGTLVPTAPPLIIINAATNGGGNIPLPIAAWPAGFPPGYEIFLQWAVADAGAPVGVSLSNCLRATMP